ncbi:hypothetical protein SJAG_00688 [Schizosaccharomyces japonicus yFS275]|uniref:Uncharacterized protein n=1 Tax=Schizosaccharomyces japonicus (strain yFS275 / FY16936) TaxID=402676 RepID=B6JWB4_SCHJY|nr:hypothetical protein SJAG_00688 [Schizosaccharomyces japonicus yFS275]EEB05665.1 hypothetical protein SJAG_00688 [Schizosaccharomyces japonicus yFS275]
MSSAAQQLADLANDKKTILHMADQDLNEVVCFPELLDKSTLVQLTDAFVHAYELAKHLGFGKPISIMNQYSQGSCVFQTAREKREQSGLVVSTTVASHNALRSALHCNKVMDQISSQL